MMDVKRPNKRAEKARETRRRILAAAGELFVEQGYGTTNLQEIADRAGVAVQTIYFVFGNKRTLLKELVDVSIAGDDEPVATVERAWFVEAMEAETAQEHLRAHVAGTREVLGRVAEIVEVLAAAAAMDPEVAAMWEHDVDPRFVVQQTAAKALMAKPGARADVPVEQAADVLFALLGPELYLVLVRDRGWAPERWEQWVFDILRPQLTE